MFPYRSDSGGTVAWCILGLLTRSSDPLQPQCLLLININIIFSIVFVLGYVSRDDTLLMISKCKWVKLKFKKQQITIDTNDQFLPLEYLFFSFINIFLNKCVINQPNRIIVRGYKVSNFIFYLKNNIFLSQSTELIVQFLYFSHGRTHLASVFNLKCRVLKQNISMLTFDFVLI